MEAPHPFVSGGESRSWGWGSGIVRVERLCSDPEIPFKRTVQTVNR